MTERKRARRLAELLHKIEALEELSLSEISLSVANHLEAEVSLVGQLGSEHLNDARYLKSLSRRLHSTSTALRNDRQRQDLQKLKVSNAKIRRTIAEKRLAAVNLEHDKRIVEEELNRTLEAALARSLVQRPASSR
jgi:hypothetical protein